MDDTAAPLMTPNEVADYLNVHLNTVYRMTADGTLTSVKVRTRLRIPRAAVEAYLAGDRT